MSQTDNILREYKTLADRGDFLLKNFILVNQTQIEFWINAGASFVKQYCNNGSNSRFMVLANMTTTYTTLNDFGQLVNNFNNLQIDMMKLANGLGSEKEVAKEDSYAWLQKWVRENKDRYGW